MKYSRLAVAFAVAGLAGVHLALAESHLDQPASVVPASLDYESYYAQDAEPASPSDQAAPAPATATGHVDACDGDCGDCSCGRSDCAWCSDLGDPWSLWDELHPSSDYHVGGWFQLGYHDESNGLMNQHPDNVNLQQGWAYLEKKVDADDYSWDWGGRADVLYGVDAQDTQAFGNNPGRWDYLNGFDFGSYGWAIPQAYVDLAYGDWKITLGKFYTLVGYEVVAAPDNFFYSHAFTQYNSEPFTHTGGFVTYSAGNDVQLFGGWTAGWDTGYDQLGQGSSFLGGFSTPLVENVTLTYISTAGDFGWRGRDAYSHSLVFDATITEKLNYIIESDLVRVGSTGEDNIGINQYLIYTVNDCLGIGARVEWWKADGVTDFRNGGRILQAVPPGSHSYYAATFGVNIKPRANLILRPEVRQEWTPFNNDSETIFGVDAIALW